MEEKDTAALAEEAEYLRLRCGISEQVDRDMFGRGMAAGAACRRAEEAFSGERRRMWTIGVLTGILARRDAAALARWKHETDEVRRWMGGGESAALPPRVREWMGRDARLVESVSEESGMQGKGDGRLASEIGHKGAQAATLSQVSRAGRAVEGVAVDGVDGRCQSGDVP